VSSALDCDFSPSSPHLLPNGLFSPQNRISFELLALSGLSGFSTFNGGKMLIFQGSANSRIVREFPPFSFKVRIATLTRNAVGRLKPTREFESLHMKLIFKNLTAPVTLAIDLFSLICIGIISCSAMLLRLVSGIIGILGIAVLVTYSPKNGLILLTIAFLFSPMGLPMIAVWILSVLQGMSGMLKSI
jgi:hypothetical protein